MRDEMRFDYQKMIKKSLMVLLSLTFFLKTFALQPHFAALLSEFGSKFKGMLSQISPSVSSRVNDLFSVDWMFLWSSSWRLQLPPGPVSLTVPRHHEKNKVVTQFKLESLCCPNGSWSCCLSLNVLTSSSSPPLVVSAEKCEGGDPAEADKLVPAMEEEVL